MEILVGLRNSLRGITLIQSSNDIDGAVTFDRYDGRDILNPG
jgi:hypothetical protein